MCVCVCVVNTSLTAHNTLLAIIGKRVDFDLFPWMDGWMDDMQIILRRYG